MDDERRRGIAWALAASLLTAGFAVPWKLAAGAGDAATNTLLLLGVAASLNTLLSVGQARWQGAALRRPTRVDWGVAAAIALLTLGGNLCSAQAIRSLSSAVLTVTLRSEVVLSAILAWPLIGERLDRIFWLGAAIAMAGLALQQPPGAWDAIAGSGLAWALAAALCFSSMTVLTRRYIHQIDPVVVNGLRLWLAVGFWFLVYGVPDAIQRISGHQALYAALAATCGPFAGRLCMMIASRYLAVRFVTLCLLLSPVLTLGLAWIVIGELPQSRAIAGGTLMLLGIAIPFVGALRPGTTPEQRRAAR